jgi:hypothetical protein
MTLSTDAFFDLDLVITALRATAETAEVDLTVTEVGSVTLTSSALAIGVATEQTEVTGPAGLGNGRTATETLALLLRVREPSAAHTAGAAARVTLRSLRALAFTALEGTRLAAGWAPLRYVGGQLLLHDAGPYASFAWVERYATERQLPIRPKGT